MTIRRRAIAALLLLSVPACQLTKSDKKDDTPSRAEEVREKESSVSPAKPESAPATTPTSNSKSQSASPPGGVVPADQLEFVEARLRVDEATGEAKKDGFRFFRLWGEVHNRSQYWVEDIRGTIRYYDANGQELKVTSIRTATKKDLGDDSPGETLRSDVNYLAPGASAPLKHLRSLNKLGGAYASYKITMDASRVATRHPDVVLEEVKDEVANVADDTLPNSNPMERRVLSGTLRNQGDLACRNPGLIVGYYQDGKLTELSQRDAPNIRLLEPGQISPVKVYAHVGHDGAWKATAKIKTWPRCSKIH